MSNEDGVNMTEDMALNTQLEKLATQYARIQEKRDALNEEAQNIRDQAETLGVPSKSFQAAVTMVKLMTEGERTDYTNGINIMLEAIGSEKMRRELFPEIVANEERRAQREAERKAKKQAEEGRSPEELNKQTDTSERSDPEKGGAGKKGKKNGKDATNGRERPSEEQLSEAAEQAAREQQEGDQVLKDMSPQSQSAQAQAKREEAGLPG